MSTKEGQETYSHRMEMVEHTFGRVEHNLSHKQMFHQGLDDIETGQLLFAINYNANRFQKLKKEQNHTVNKKSDEKSLQTTLTHNQEDINSENYNNNPKFNPKFYNNKHSLNIKATIA